MSMIQSQNYSACKGWKQLLYKMHKKATMNTLEINTEIKIFSKETIYQKETWEPRNTRLGTFIGKTDIGGKWTWRQSNKKYLVWTKKEKVIENEQNPGTYGTITKSLNICAIRFLKGEGKV